MSNNIEKFRVEEKIRQCCIKHFGDILKVENELGYDLAYIKQVHDKFKREDKEFVAKLVSAQIMQHLIKGLESRTKQYTEMLEWLEGKETVTFSTCCRALVIDEGPGRQPLCVKCNQVPPNVYVRDNFDILQLKKGFLKELRKEGDALLKYSSTLGYTDSSKKTEQNPSAPIFVNASNQVINNNVNKISTNTNKIKAIDHDIPRLEFEGYSIAELQKLPPIERVAIIKRAKAKYEESKEADGQGTAGSGS